VNARSHVLDRTRDRKLLNGGSLVKMMTFGIFPVTAIGPSTTAVTESEHPRAATTGRFGGISPIRNVY